MPSHDLTKVDLSHVHVGLQMLMRHLRTQRNIIEKNLVRAYEEQRVAKKVLEEVDARIFVEEQLRSMISRDINDLTHGNNVVDNININK
jgi:hypothetical protein